MSTPSLENKTIRPGSLLDYSYYYANANKRRPPTKASNKKSSSNSKKPKATKPPQRHYKGKLLAVLLLAVIAGLLIHSFDHKNAAKVIKVSRHVTTSVTKKVVAATPTPTPAPVAAPVATPCTGNALDERIIVSISARHLWACNQGTSAYDSPVVTGISYLAADLTPTGTYHIYEKETDQNLIGSDSTGSWNDFVYYWMPFLHNEYGTYGLHDATWRDPSAFGNISPDSADASHGCVEMPLATAKWIYNWSYIGTTVTIES
jgi:lipoprotein-anchoring transpeptidase ErfK/SrfK